MIKCYSGLLVVVLCGTIPAAAMGSEMKGDNLKLIKLSGNHAKLSLLYASWVESQGGCVEDEQDSCIQIVENFTDENKYDNGILEKFCEEHEFLRFLPWFIKGDNEASKKAIAQLGSFANGTENHADQLLNKTIRQALKNVENHVDHSSVLKEMEKIANGGDTDNDENTSHVIDLLRGNHIKKINQHTLGTTAHTNELKSSLRSCESSLQKAFLMSTYCAAMSPKSLSAAFNHLSNFGNTELCRNTANESSDYDNNDDKRKKNFEIAFPLLATLMVDCIQRIERKKNVDWNEQLATLARVSLDKKWQFTQNLQKFLKDITPIQKTNKYLSLFFDNVSFFKKTSLLVLTIGLLYKCYNLYLTIA